MAGLEFAEAPLRVGGSNPAFFFAALWIASRSLSSLRERYGARRGRVRAARWLAMTVLGCLKIEIPVHANTLVVPGLDPGIHQPS
jgi:hypothetical protein